MTKGASRAALLLAVYRDAPRHAPAAMFNRTELGLGTLEGVVVAVVSGGNVDPERYNRLLAGDS